MPAPSLPLKYCYLGPWGHRRGGGGHGRGQWKPPSAQAGTTWGMVVFISCQCLKPGASLQARGSRGEPGEWLRSNFSG